MPMQHTRPSGRIEMHAPSMFHCRSINHTHTHMYTKQGKLMRLD